MYICLFAVLAALPGIASDEIQGSAADVLAAIREKAIGRVYAFDALISVPPTDAESQFVVRDRTGSVVIRRDFDWPDETFRTGDSVRLRCEIGATASLPASAFFRSMTLLARDAVSGETHGNWLVTTRSDESARVTKLPRYLTRQTPSSPSRARRR